MMDVIWVAVCAKPLNNILEKVAIIVEKSRGLVGKNLAWKPGMAGVAPRSPSGVSKMSSSILLMRDSVEAGDTSTVGRVLTAGYIVSAAVGAEESMSASVSFSPVLAACCCAVAILVRV